MSNTKVIEGIEYLAVPSSTCRSLHGGIQCSQFGTNTDCNTTGCTATPGQHVCFITQAQYPAWLKAKLIGDTNGRSN